MPKLFDTRRILYLLAVGGAVIVAYNVYRIYTVNLARPDPGDMAAVETVSLPRLPLSEQQKEQLSDAQRGLDPSESGWQTESFNDAAASQLKILAKGIEHGDLESVNALIPSDFVCSPLRPIGLRTVVENSYLRVLRTPEREGSKDARGPNSLASAMADLPATQSIDCHVKFKIVGVQLNEPQKDIATTDVYAEGFGVGSVTGHPTQWTATWKCQWDLATEKPRLAAIDVVSYEEVENIANGHWLVDETEIVFGANASYRQQLAYGMDHWLGQLSGRLGISRLGHNGMAIGDINGDNRPDVYVCQSGGLPNRLYVQRSDGTVVDQSATAGVDFLDDTTCALLVDLDNDGDQDLALATISGGLVLTNDGTGHFSQAAYLPECRNAFSLTAADYDQDGLLDLYVGRYWPTAENRGEIPIPVPYFDGQNGGANVLLRNEGDWKFADVTSRVGLEVENFRYTMAAAWEDLDNDGDVDLYVANDFGKNCLYENYGGQFRNIASQAGVEDIASGMSVTFSDVDRDGNSDIYVSNMFSSAGNRIAYQRQYADRFDDGAVKSLRRMARGNSLFRNVGDGTFHDESLASATTMGRWSWGSLFADVNNDGWDDLLVANGNITAEKPGDL